MSSSSATQDTSPYGKEPVWSGSEKAVARKVFQTALKRKLEEVMQQTKRMASQIKEPTEVWDIEHYLTKRRKEIDRKYDNRYSQLTTVLGRLLGEGRISEKDLDGLREDKIRVIRSLARIVADDAA